MEISDETYKTFLALREQKKEKTAPKLLPAPSFDVSLTVCTIHFDGGTGNNVPSMGGFGIGYGSYVLNVVKWCQLTLPMRCQIMRPKSGP